MTASSSDADPADRAPIGSASIDAVLSDSALSRVEALPLEQRAAAYDRIIAGLADRLQHVRGPQPLGR